MAAPEPARPSRVRGLGLPVAMAMLFAIGATWGLIFSLAKLVTEAGAHPFGLALLQGLLGAILLLPYCIVRSRGMPLNFEHLRFYAVAGVLGTALPSTILFSSAAHLPAGILAIITALVPMMTYAISLGLRIERYAFLRSLGIVLGLSAALMIVLPEASLPQPAMAGWVLFALLVPASYSGENVFIALCRPAKSDSVVLLCGMQIAGAAMLLPLVWLSGTWVSLAPPWTEVEWWIVALIVINTAAYLLFIELIRTAGPVFAAQAGYLITASGIFWGMAIFDEQHSGWVWAALVVLLAGLSLVNPRPAYTAR